MYFAGVLDYVINAPGGRRERVCDIPELYHAADVLMATRLQNQLVDMQLARARQTKGHCDLRAVRDAHVHMVTRTPLYQLIFKSCVKRLADSPTESEEFEWQTVQLGRYPGAVLDVLRMTNKHLKEKWSDPWVGDWCEFHIHPDGERCDSQHQPPSKRIKLS